MLSNDRRWLLHGHRKASDVYVDLDSCHPGESIIEKILPMPGWSSCDNSHQLLGHGSILHQNIKDISLEYYFIQCSVLLDHSSYC